MGSASSLARSDRKVQDVRSREGGTGGIWWFWHAVVAMVAVTTAAIVIAAVVDQAAVDRAIATEAKTYTPVPMPTTAPVPSLQSAVSVLKSQTGKAWVLAVVGDSTGAGSDRWVHRSASALSAKYGRPVELHDWDLTKNAYSAPVTIGSGSNAPITIWNGSASGMPPSYSLAHLKALVPQQPNALIVNHGHNCASGDECVQGIGQILDTLAATWSSPPAEAVILQNPRLDSTASTQDQVVAAERAAFPSTSSLTAIDVYDQFKQRDLRSLLVSDERHPNSAGSQLWADTVDAVLGAG